MTEQDTKPKKSVELLPLELRNLPSELVTKDLDDESKVHELDPPHIKGALISDYADQENEKVKMSFDEPEAPELVTKSHKLTQLGIDVVRLRVLRAWAETQKGLIREGFRADLAPRHLWFPNDDDRMYCMRGGNAPSDSDRPKHLKGMKLEIDIGRGEIPAEIRHKLAAKGIEVNSTYYDAVKAALNRGENLDTWQ